MKQFEEKKFLSVVKHLTTNVCVNLVSDQCAKKLIECAIKHCGYEKSDVYEYFKVLLDENMSGYMNKVIERYGWRKIYSHFIKHKGFCSLGKILEEKLPLLRNCEEYELCFITAATLCGHNPEHLMTELYLDYIGWVRFVDTLVKISDEMSVDVPVVIKEKKHGGRPKKETVSKAPKPTSLKRGRGKVGKPVEQYTPTGEFVKVYTSVREAASEVGVSTNNIYSVLKGNTKSAGGFIWKYKEVGTGETTETLTTITTPTIKEEITSTEPVKVEEEPTTTKMKSKMTEKLGVYYFNEDKTLDLTRPIGVFNSRKDITTTLGIGKPTLSKIINGKCGEYKGAWCFIDGVKVKVGIRVEAAA